MPESKRAIIANVPRLHQYMDRHRLSAVVARSGQNFTYISGLANPGTLPLELIEVHSGSYLGEDDIVRFDDTYGRVPDRGWRRQVRSSRLGKMSSSSPSRSLLALCPHP